MDPRLISMLKYASKPITENTSPGENILILTDTATDPLVWQALSAAAHAHGAIPTVALMTTREGDGHDPTLPALSAVREADTIILATYRSQIHARGFMETLSDMRKKGRRPKVFLMEQCNPELLSGGAVEEDTEWMHQVGSRVKAAWDRGSTVQVTSEYGTDLRADIKGRISWLITGRLHPESAANQGPFPDIIAFPDGECGIGPVEGSGEGVIVWDLSCHQLGFLQQPIKLTIRHGKVVKIEGGTQAQQLERFLEEQKDPNCYNAPCEIAIGLNRKATPIGLMRVDKKLYGSAHIAIGGLGDTHAKLHLDGLLRAPRVVVDEKIVLCEGGQVKA
ncbi:MAG: aminopeptidase [Chloroflexi bacterium]|nr:aminopeptidase [Chloroflexota bacterium]